MDARVLPLKIEGERGKTFWEGDDKEASTMVQK